MPSSQSKPLSPGFTAFVQATAGAVGGVLASLLLQPLEVAKTRISIGQSKSLSTLPTIATIYAEEGLGGVFRGVNAKCTETGTKNFVYFYVYDALNTIMKRQGLLSGRVKLLLGYLAGACTTISTMPLEVIATQLQTETSASGSLLLLRRILTEEGISGLFKGFWSNIALCVNPAIQNACFDQMKAWTLKVKRRTTKHPVLTPFEAFLWGAVAKAIATVITYPLVRLKTVLQAGSPQSPNALCSVAGEHSKNGNRKEGEGAQKEGELKKDGGQNVTNGKLECCQDFRRIIQQFLSIYQGLGSMLTKSVSQAAVLYMVKDQVGQLVVRLFKLTAKMMRGRSGRLKLAVMSGRPLAS